MGYDVTRQGLGWTLFFFALLLLLFWKRFSSRSPCLSIRFRPATCLSALCWPA